MRKEIIISEWLKIDLLEERQKTIKEMFNILDSLKSKHGNVVILKDDYLKLKKKYKI